jgi:uncharacterized protein YecT (DUF1311 family)
MKRIALATMALFTADPALHAATAASFDCAQARAPVEKTICADPALSTADDELGKRFNAALEISLDPGGLRLSQAEWLKQSRDAASREELALVYAHRQQELERDIARLQAKRAGRLASEVAAKAACLPALVDAESGETCKVVDYAPLASLDGHAFAYAHYEYASKQADGAHDTRIVVFELAGGMARVVLSPDGDDAIAYDKPRVLHAGARALLHLPAYESGTGNFNRERLFLWRDAHWLDVDATTWLNELAHRLPAGLGVWKGVFPDYSALSACTPLWRKQDGNCCPTGGRADLALGWRGDRIALQSIRLRKAGECDEPSRPDRGDD